MSIGLGVGVFIAGLVIVTLAFLMLRLFARTHSAPNESLVSPSSSLKSNSRDAVIVIQPGGRVEYLSTAARPFSIYSKMSPLTLNVWQGMCALQMILLIYV